MEKTSPIIEAVFQEYEKLFINDSGGFSDEKPVNELVREYASGESNLMVLTDNADENDIEGFCFFYKSSPDKYCIDYLGVPMKYRNRGIGKRLLTTVINHCLSDPEISEIWLLCRDDKISYYTKFGFYSQEQEIINDIRWNKMVNKNDKSTYGLLRI